MEQPVNPDSNARPERLGILIYSLGGGGAERVVSHLLPYLRAKNVEVHLYLMCRHFDYEVPADLPIHYLEDSSPTESGLWKLIKIPYLAYSYARLHKRHGINTSFSLLTRPNYINVLSNKLISKKARVIISERGQPSLQYRGGGLRARINRYLIRNLYGKADLILCNSQGNRSDLIDNFQIPGSKIEVINNPIDLEKMADIQPKQDFFDPSFFNLITLGRLNKGKNHRMLINAVASLTGVRLYIMGEGELEAELQDLIDELNLTDRVFLTGFDANPYPYLKAADLFVFGSEHEGFPNVLLEAMACGLPIVTTNCPSGPDEIMLLEAPLTDAPMMTPHGILVPVGDTESMRYGIDYMMKNPDYLQNCKINGLKRVGSFEKTLILQEFMAKLRSGNGIQ